MTVALILSVALVSIAWLWLRFAKWEVSQPVWSTLDVAELEEAASPLVSIVLVAQGPAQDLRRCVQSLLRQDYPRFEIIVVEAHSCGKMWRDSIEGQLDADGKLAILDAELPPTGGLRRAVALQQGVDRAGGEWLLFTTAESYHAPGLLSRAMAYATRQELGMLSLAPRQESRAFWEHICHPVAWQYLCFLMPMERVGETNSRGVWASEEFLLVSRVAYKLAGGHAAVASEAQAGSALMRRVKSLGYRVEYVKAMDLLQARSYRTWRQVWEGWSQCFYQVCGPHPLRVVGHVAGVVAWAVLPFAALIPAFSFGFWGLDAIHGWWDVVLAVCAIIAGVTILQAASVVRRVHRQNHLYTATLPLGGLFVAAAGLYGLVLAGWGGKRGGVGKNSASAGGSANCSHRHESC
jgi:chlorobactene glucosyltransferase